MVEPEGPPKSAKTIDWQRHCTTTLMDIIALPEQGCALKWSNARKSLIKLARSRISIPREQRIIIADADLKNQRLKGFNFSHCYIIRTDLRSADLRDCNFDYAMIRECLLNGADVKGATFWWTDMKGTNVDNLHYNSLTRLNFASFEPSGLPSSKLQDRVDQDRLAASNRNAPALNRFLNLLTGYGFRFWPLLLICAGLVLLFALGYRWIGPRGFAIGAGTATSDFSEFLELPILFG